MYDPSNLSLVLYYMYIIYHRQQYMYTNTVGQALFYAKNLTLIYLQCHCLYTKHIIANVYTNLTILMIIIDNMVKI